MFAMLGMVTAMRMPATGLTLTTRADRLAAALTSIAESDPKVMRLLLRITSVGKYAALASVASEVVVAVGVDTGAVPIDSVVAIPIRDVTERLMPIDEGAPDSFSPMA